jgi:histidine triad (HIT) family protein
MAKSRRELGVALSNQLLSVDFLPDFWYIFVEIFLLITTSMIDCTFCSIARGESSAEILYQNEHAVAILDINPIHYGHVLVLPRQHAETFLEVPETELGGLIRATQIVSRAVVNSLNPPGFNIFSNNGKAAGQSVFHFHFHITPRYADDNIRFILQLKKYSGDEMAAYAERIRQKINSDHIHTKP